MKLWSHQNLCLSSSFQQTEKTLANRENTSITFGVKMHYWYLCWHFGISIKPLVDKRKESLLKQAEYIYSYPVLLTLLSWQVECPFCSQPSSSQLWVLVRKENDDKKRKWVGQWVFIVHIINKVQYISHLTAHTHLYYRVVITFEWLYKNWENNTFT